jgi:pimeloyl-ACP methyl ester carboxylesterase
MSPMSRPTADDFRSCLTEPARLVETARGAVEYAERGEGPGLLSVHGSPGAHEQGLLLAEFFRVNGYRVIAPSRPGSSRTPLAAGRTPSEQADLLVSLLDALDIDRVAVMGSSAGGPSTYALAARHPERVSRLLEVAAACLPVSASWTNRIERLMFSNRALVALQLWLVDRFPERALRMMGSTGPATPEEVATRAAFMRAMLESATDWPRLQVGNDNDEAQFAALAELPLGDITCPTLIIQGRGDRIAVPHAEHAHAAIDGSELMWIEGGHPAFWLDLDAQQRALSWLRDEPRPVHGHPTAPPRP